MDKKYIMFAGELEALCKKHDVILVTGVVRMSDLNGYLKDTFSIAVSDEVTVANLRDTYGPFLISNADRKQQENNAPIKGYSFQICDREKLMNGGTESPIDGKIYTSRNAYEQHVKDHGWSILGDDNVNPKRMERKRERDESRRSTGK